MRTPITAFILLLTSLNADNAMPTAQEACTPQAFVRGAPFDAGCQPGIRLWVEADFLYLWTKNSPLPVALATTGSTSDPVPAALGQPHTSVLFGKESIHNGALSGFRIAALSWIGCNQDYAIEGSGFYLPEKTKDVFSTSSSSVLGVPFNDVAPFPLPANHGGWMLSTAGQTAVLLGFSPIGALGSINIDSSTQLWGAELDGLYRFFSKPSFRLSVLGGISYTDLKESLEMKYYSSNTPQQVFKTAYLKDYFGTHNEIFAAQLGLRSEWSDHWLFVSVLAKIGLGAALERSYIHGTFSDPVPNLYYTYGRGSSGGIFAQPTNSGKHSQVRFEAIPSATVRFGFNIIRDLRISVGYDILFLSNVVRPGDQIDEKINETQAGPNGGTTPTLTGPARPEAHMKITNYWAQGINAGIEGRF